MTKIKAYKYYRKVKGRKTKKLIKVPAHNRRTYKGYHHGKSSAKRSYKQDRKRKAKYRPRKKYKKGLGNQGDW
jgi:hypothetical protein